MTNAMTKAWEIRRRAAKKFNCKVMEIDFAECLRMAWTEIKNADLFKFFETAAKLCVTGAAGLKKLALKTGETTDVAAAIKILIKWFEKTGKELTVQNFALWMNLEIAKM